MTDLSPSNLTPEILEKLVIESIKTVYDPEIPVNVYDLGLIYNVDVKPDFTVTPETRCTWVCS